MTAPGGWEASVHLSRQQGSGFVEAPGSFIVALRNYVELRSWWRASNGSGPIPLGNLYLEYHDGTEWKGWAGWWGKNVAPYWSYHLVDHPGDIVYWEPYIDPVLFENGETYRMRSRLTWVDGDHYSPEFEFTTRGVLEIEGGLAEFFADGEIATLDGFDLVRVIFQDPAAKLFEIEGTRPEIIIETAIVDAQGYTRGTSVLVRGDPYTIRSLAVNPDGTTTARLEDAS